METRDRMCNQGEQGQEKQKPGQGGVQQQGGREGQGNQEPGEGGSQKAAGRSKSNFVRNDGLATEGEDVRQEQGESRGEHGYKYKGGRQGMGGIPNPADRDDNDSAGSLAGTADRPSSGCADS